jgi:hypothetical protein
MRDPVGSPPPPAARLSARPRRRSQVPGLWDYIVSNGRIAPPPETYRRLMHGVPHRPAARNAPPPPARSQRRGAARRVRLIRGEGRGVSD